MNPAELKELIVSSWHLLNAAIVAGIAIAFVTVTVIAAFREFGTRRLRFL